MNRFQHMTWELLLILGLVVLFVSPVGEWLGSIVEEIATGHNVKLNLNPFQKSTGVLPGGDITHGPMIPGNGDNGNGTSLFDVPIIGPDGTPGTIQVVANDPTSATQNASQGGNTPTGAPVPV